MLAELIARDLDLDTDKNPLPPDESVLVEALSVHIEEMLRLRPEFLMSSLYRLDIPESLLRVVLHPGAIDPPAVGVAKLIIERQRIRLATKLAHTPPPERRPWWLDEGDD
jgi:hypothetical protein